MKKTTFKRKKVDDDKKYVHIFTIYMMVAVALLDFSFFLSLPFSVW